MPCSPQGATLDFRASEPAGLEQVGCVYTAQGFEFDYIGVIVGPDLVYRAMDGGWFGQPEQSKDRIVSRGVTCEEFTRYVKSTYRVLRLLRRRPHARLRIEPRRAPAPDAAPGGGGRPPVRPMSASRRTSR
jgi:hypothetical protein